MMASDTALNSQVNFMWLFKCVKFMHCCVAAANRHFLLSVYAEHSIKKCNSSSTELELHIWHTQWAKLVENMWKSREFSTWISGGICKFQWRDFHHVIYTWKISRVYLVIFTTWNAREIFHVYITWFLPRDFLLLVVNTWIFSRVYHQ